MNEHSRIARQRRSRGESVVLAIRTTRTIATALDANRGALTRSSFASRALQYALEGLASDEKRALERFRSAPAGDRRGALAAFETDPAAPLRARLAERE